MTPTPAKIKHTPITSLTVITSSKKAEPSIIEKRNYTAKFWTVALAAPTDCIERT